MLSTRGPPPPALTATPSRLPTNTSNTYPFSFSYCLLLPCRSKVREKALESIQAVARCLSAEQLTAHLVPLLSRLTLKEWFTARMSACCLAPSTYALLRLLLPPSKTAAAAAAAAAAEGGDKETEVAAAAAGDPGTAARAQVRHLFKKLCTDDTPMVRR